MSGPTTDSCLPIAEAAVLPAFGGLTGALTLRRADLARQQARVAVLGEASLHWLL